MTKLPLSVRLILGVLLVQALAMGILTWNGARLADVRQGRLLERTVWERATLLGVALGPALADRDHSAAHDALEVLKDNAQVLYAAVYDRQALPVASLGEPPPVQNLETRAESRLYRDDGQLLVDQPIRRGGRVLGRLRMAVATDEQRLLSRHIWMQNTAVALLGLVLATLAIVFTTFSLRRDLRALSGGARALDERRFEHRIGLAGKDELGDAARALNSLGQHLQADRDRRRHQQERLIQELRRLNTLLHGINAVVWEVEPNTARFRYVSSDAERLLGYETDLWLRPDFLQRIVHPGDLSKIQGFLNHPGNFAGSLTVDFRVRKRDQGMLWLRLIGSVEPTRQGPLLRGLLLDVTDEKKSEQRIAYLADHDSLTGLINRRRFQEKLDEQIAYARRYATSGGLLFIDLDQFKYINDSYGHHTGDEYLRQVAGHLQASLRETDVVGRLGGDEFGIVLPSANEDQATKVGQSVLDLLNHQDFVHDGRRMPFHASIGIVLFPRHGQQASELLARADSAMYSAKEQGRNTYRLFDESIDAARMQEKIHWEDRIRGALRDGRLKLYFQPIVDTVTGQVRHYESLLRMVGEKGEIIGPGAFISIAERFGLIREIDRWVVEAAIRTQGASSQLRNPVALTINLSGRHFGSSDILQLIQDATRRYGANPNNIVFEVTETAAVENFTEAVDFINALRDMGYRFALDDFGAGFSSFHYLKHIPVDYVKIDGSFVRNLHQNPTDRIFVKAIAEMARGLHVTTIAEFVENREILEVLRKLGVPLGQGYYFGKPTPGFLEDSRVAV